MNCHKCNTPNPPNVSACYHCGNKITEIHIFNSWKNDAFILIGLLLGYFLMRTPYLILNIYNKMSHFENSLTDVYRLLGYFNIAFTLVLFTIAIILAKNKTVRLFLILLAFFDILFDVLFRFVLK
jgi:hypothetical protein